MTAKVKCANEFNALYLYASSGTETYKTDTTYSDNQWHTITIDGIKISGGIAEVGIYADGKANYNAKIDDMTLVKIEDKDFSAIENVNIMPTDVRDIVEYYSLTGMKLQKPVKGLNIIRETTGGKISVRKIVIE